MRAPAGIQLGRSVRPGFLRVMEVLVAGLVLVAAWGGVALLAVRAELADARLPGPGAASRSGAEAAPGFDPRDAQAAAVLLLSGVLGAPDIGAAFETVMETASSGIRIAGIEVRSTGDPDRVEAVIAAGAASPSAVAGFLSALGDHPSVLASEVISETRQTDGTAMIRITAHLDLGRGVG